MSSATTRQLLRTACSLVPAHGFTREALSRSVLHLPEPHTVPLSDTAVSALFGGHQANKCLVNAWLEKGLEEMKEAANPTIRATLHARLRYNEPVLQYLPEAFGMLAAPGSISFRRPPPVLEHPARIADAACRTSGDQSLHTTWYMQRAKLMAIYSVAELHQLASPGTAHDFLDSLLDETSFITQAFSEVNLFTTYIASSWKGIFNSKGII